MKSIIDDVSAIKERLNEIEAEKAQERAKVVVEDGKPSDWAAGTQWHYADYDPA